MISSVKSSAIVPIDIMGKSNCCSESAKKENRLVTEKQEEIKVEHSNVSNFISYKKMSRDFFEPLIRFVDKLVSLQDEIYKKVREKISNEELDKIEDMVFENGPHGVKKTADKILNYAKLLVSDDKSKAGQIKNAVNQGFIQAEKSNGNLSDIGQRTLDNAMNKIDAWYKENP